jgi:hypothetical protein
MTSFHEQKIQLALEDPRTKKFALVSVIHWLEQEEEDTLGYATVAQLAVCATKTA